VRAPSLAHRRRASLILVVAALLAPACTSTTSTASGSAPSASTAGTAEGAPMDPAATQTSASAPVTTTVPASTVAATATRPTEPGCGQPATGPDEAQAPRPPALADALTARLADSRFDHVLLGASVWIEGYGEVVAHNADLLLLPASNQKLLTGLASLIVLPRDGTFVTEVHARGPIDDGVLAGELALVGGGDPTFTRIGANSLDELARQVRDAGIRVVRGPVVADESRQESARAAEGWQDWQIPTYAGPLSALTVDDNRYRKDGEYLEEPAVENAEAFVDALRRTGVEVDGPVVAGVTAPGATRVASSASRPYPELVAEMLLRSDNETAEMLVREMGLLVGGAGTTETGVRVVELALETELCVELGGHSGDGSGLSRSDLRSARELRVLFQAALGSPWGPELDAALPVGARTGTLAGRFGGTAAAGNLRAKTGSIIGGRALTGHLRTAGGREVVFSILANGDGSPAAQHAIDALVVTLAADLS
jgi:D-alanyl-D-alanine carboxypeptidase/D-alanyl-D-alanine-endopeptidase (penicillin-binding protein 4)